MEGCPHPPIAPPGIAGGGAGAAAPPAPPSFQNPHPVASPNLQDARSGTSSLDTTPTLGDRATLFATSSPDPASMFDGDTKLMPYVDWVAARIRALGGVATSASLGSPLRSEEITS